VDWKLQVSCSEDGRFDFREEELEGALALLFQGEQVQVQVATLEPGEDEHKKRQTLGPNG
jgi:hypothetical protein